MVTLDRYGFHVNNRIILYNTSLDFSMSPDDGKYHPLLLRVWGFVEDEELPEGSDGHCYMDPGMAKDLIWQLQKFVDLMEPRYNQLEELSNGKHDTLLGL